MRTEDEGKTLPPGEDDVRTKRFTANLYNSWAWNLRPSPPHLPTGHCQVKMRYGLEGCLLGSHIGAEKQGQDSGRVKSSTLA